jgi:diguanylate cyclase (GGDEF)-like protein
MEARTFVIFTGSFATFSTLFLGIYALRRRRSSPSALPFALLMLSTAAYATAYSFELCSGSLEGAASLLRVEYMGVMLVPLFWLIFARTFAQGASQPLAKTWRPGPLVALAAIPVLTIALMWTNESHHLVYTSLRLRPDSSLSILVGTRGPWYWVCTAYLYLLLVSGAAMIALRVARSEGSFRGQGLSLLAAAFLPWVGHILLLSRASPFGIDLTPFLLPISGGLFALAIFKFGMFDLMPVAREMVVDAIRDGVIVVDPSGRIVDANRAARLAVPELEGAIARSEAGALLAKLGVPALGEAELSIGEGASARCYRACALEIEEEGRKRGTVVLISDVTESKGLLARLEALATTDELTGVDNRRRFFEHAERELAVARRRGRAISFAMLDLDLFKRVNDERGHAAGDAALVAVCDACRSALRASDILCRYGGEEFVIILPEAAPADAFEIVERVRGRIEAASIHAAGDAFGVTASFGVAGYPGGEESPASLEAYLRQSDEALYCAKQAGRNRVFLYGVDS